MNNNQYCVILAGGAGSRLWPVSKLSYPKQFLMSENGRTFIQATYERFCAIVPPENIIVVTAKRYKDIVCEQIPELPENNILCEPYARSTAPAILYASYVISKRDPSATIVVTPSDHIIFDQAAFRADILSALEFASHNNVLVTLGVTPTRPDPNFGYIQVVGGRNAFRKGDPLPVKTFTEKPDTEMAKVFLSTGEFMWNAGIFAWRASVIIDEIQTHMPLLAGQFQGWEEAIGTPSEREFIDKAYGGCEKTAIDTGVMEKTFRAWVYPAEFDWVDIGTWESIYDSTRSDNTDGNKARTGASVFNDSANNLVISTNKEKLVAVKGLDKFMVIDTPDVLIVCPRDSKQYNDLVSAIGLPGYEKYR